MASVYREGTKWRVIARRKGHRPQSGTFKTKALAEREGRRFESEFDAGLHRHVDVVRTSSVRELFTKFIEEELPKRGGRRWDRLRLDFYGDPIRCPEFDCSLAELNRDRMQTVKIKRLAKIANSTFNRELNLLSSVFEHAIKEWGMTLVNPVKLIQRPPGTPARNRRITAEEMTKLRFGDQPIPRSRHKGFTRDIILWMAEFAVETGLRVGEICALRHADVHLDEHWVWVAAIEEGAKKNGEPRAVPLSPRASEILAAMDGLDSRRVFPVNKKSVDVLFRRMCRELGIVGLHFHDLRHEAVSRLAQRLPLMELSAVIGHRDLASLKVYYHPTPEELVAKLHGTSAATPARPSSGTQPGGWAD